MDNISLKLQVLQGSVDQSAGIGALSEWTKLSSSLSAKDKVTSKNSVAIAFGSLLSTVVSFLSPQGMVSNPSILDILTAKQKQELKRRLDKVSFNNIGSKLFAFDSKIKVGKKYNIFYSLPILRNWTLVNMMRNRCEQEDIEWINNTFIKMGQFLSSAANQLVKPFLLTKKIDLNQTYGFTDKHGNAIHDKDLHKNPLFFSGIKQINCTNDDNETEISDAIKLAVSVFSNSTQWIAKLLKDVSENKVTEVFSIPSFDGMVNPNGGATSSGLKSALHNIEQKLRRRNSGTDMAISEYNTIVNRIERLKNPLSKTTSTYLATVTGGASIVASGVIGLTTNVLTTIPHQLRNKLKKAKNNIYFEIIKYQLEDFNKLHRSNHDIGDVIVGNKPKIKPAIVNDEIKNTINSFYTSISSTYAMFTIGGYVDAGTLDWIKEQVEKIDNSVATQNSFTYMKTLYRQVASISIGIQPEQTTCFSINDTFQDIGNIIGEVVEQSKTTGETVLNASKTIYGKISGAMKTGLKIVKLGQKIGKIVGIASKL